jgi:glycosyltransferase involved in cell wall biosynthesis
MTQRRIALVSAFPPGKLSLNEYGLHFARHLAARPDVAEVIVFADILPDPMAELDLGPKVRVRRIWRFNALGTAVTIVRALRAAKVDAAIFNLQTTSFGDHEVSAALGLGAPMLARLAGVPAAVVAHNLISGIDLENTILKGQPLRQKVVQLGGAVVTGMMLRANYLTTTLQGYVDILKQMNPRADVSLVPHGTFDTTQRPWVAHATRPRRMVTMGKFGTYKRLETLLSAFDILRQQPQFQDMQLVVGGTDHPNTPGYVASVAKTRAGDAGVVFAGYLAEEAIPAFFENALISVFDYSNTTGSSGVLHQTASYGAAPVFPHIGDFVDLCRDEGLAGYNYTPGDARGMAAVIARALSDPAATEAMARANHAAAHGMPFSDVIGFHMDRLGAIWARQSGQPQVRSGTVGVSHPG